MDRRLKDKRAPEEIELLNNAFNLALNLLGMVIVMTRFAIWSLARLSRSARQALASREKSRKLAVARIGLRFGARFSWRRLHSECQPAGIDPEEWICRLSRNGCDGRPAIATSIDTTDMRSPIAATRL